MKTALALVVVLALAAGPSLAKTKPCTDPATHKRIACPAAASSAAPASRLVMPAVMKPPKG